MLNWNFSNVWDGVMTEVQNSLPAQVATWPLKTAVQKLLQLSQSAYQALNDSQQNLTDAADIANTNASQLLIMIPQLDSSPDLDAFIAKNNEIIDQIAAAQAKHDEYQSKFIPVRDFINNEWSSIQSILNINQQPPNIGAIDAMTGIVVVLGLITVCVLITALSRIALSILNNASGTQAYLKQLANTIQTTNDPALKQKLIASANKALDKSPNPNKGWLESALGISGTALLWGVGIFAGIALLWTQGIPKFLKRDHGEH